MKFSFIFVIALLVSASAIAEKITFKAKGKPVNTLSVEELKTLLPPPERAKALTIYEGHEGRVQEYRALDFKLVLTQIYGEAWKQAEEILFSCTDGYQPSVPVAKFKSHLAMLAFDKTKNQPFSFTNKESGQLTSYGPLYLIWENIKDLEIKGEGLSDRPYAITSIDLISFADRFPGLAPPKGSSESAMRGFLRFRKECLQCHRINGEGGEKAIELNYPVAAVEYWNERYLAQWIQDPRSVRAGATMPGLRKQLPNRPEVTADLIAYLKTMATVKKKPPSP